MNKDKKQLAKNESQPPCSKDYLKAGKSNQRQNPNWKSSNMLQN